MIVNRCIVGSCIDILPTLDAGSVQMCVTSPPYWGLRDYGHEAQIGQETTPEEFVKNLVGVFSQVKRVLKDDGTCWINIGDSYSSGGRTSTTTQTLRTQVLDNKRRSKNSDVAAMTKATAVRPPVIDGVKPKDLVGIPWMLAFALRSDGWYLRQDIIWHKPSTMPESVTDRCTKAHEYIFLLAKNEHYYYNNEAIKEPSEHPDDDRKGRSYDHHKSFPDAEKNGIRPGNYLDSGRAGYPMRNKRSVWSVTNAGFSGAHFATFPPKLIEPCILAGSRPGDIVLDPFGGSGTTGMVCESLGRKWLLIELNPDYGKLSKDRTAQQGIVFE